MTDQPYSPFEQEVVILNAVWDMIDGMVNYAMFVKGHGTVDTNLMFNTAGHQQLFNVLLVDFLSMAQANRSGRVPFDLPRAPEGSPASSRTYLFYLKQVCAQPALGPDATGLAGAVDGFATWLEADAVVPKVWFPAIETQLDMRVRRIEFLKICGNIAKHNFARLEDNVRRIRRIMADNGCTITEAQGYSLLPEFYEWFHRDIFSYHASTIAAFLNDIRWGIFDYLGPEFARSFERVEPEPMYRYSVPPECVHPLAREMYWDLMNRCRSRVYFPRFTVTPSLRLRY